MEEAIRRIVQRLFPELTGGYHLPRFAEVVNARQTPQGGEIHDEFKPVYAVDIQVLTEHGEPDTKFPVLKDVPLPIPVAGHESGFYAFPENGTWVEVGFAYGSPNKPFIRCILPHGRSLIPVERGEQRWQHNPASYQWIDKDGSHERITDRAITDKSLTRSIEAMENSEAFTQSTRTIEADDTHLIGGSKTVKVNGAMNLLAGGRCDIGAAKDLHLTSLTNQRYKAPKTWLGSQDESVLRQLSELMQLVIDLCNILSSHTHPSVGACSQGGQISTVGSDTSAVKARLDGIKE
jgi:hypothetical protein